MNYDKTAAHVASMFASIASRYDRTNTVLSLGIHHLWKQAVAARIPRGGIALDLCTGTGDLLPLLKQRCDEVIGGDFCVPMLDIAVKRGFLQATPLLKCDALTLPFPDAVFDSITIAFGVRNFENLESGILEVSRILKKGGSLVILEFGQPAPGLWREVYGWYQRTFIPRLGQMLTGNADAYRYLPETSAAFPCGQQFSELLSRHQLNPIETKSLSGGIAYLYSAIKINP